MIAKKWQRKGKGRINLYLKNDIIDYVKERASREQRSMISLCSEMLIKQIKADKKKGL